MTLETFLIILGFIFGGICGSFFNVVIYRLPKAQSIVMPPSHCMKCGEPINWYDNIPLISYILLGGRCRACKEPYSFRYFVIELLTAVLFALVLSKYVETITRHSLSRGVGLTLFHFFFVGGMIISAFTDLDHRIIPNEVTYPGVPIGLLAAFLLPEMMFPEKIFVVASDHWKSLLLAFLASVGAGGFLLGIGEVVKRMLRPYPVCAPVAGTFLAKSSSESSPPLAVGQLVDGDDPVGVIKASRNEEPISLDLSGKIAAWFLSDGQRVERGQPMFRMAHIRPNGDEIRRSVVIGLPLAVLGAIFLRETLRFVHTTQGRVLVLAAAAAIVVAVACYLKRALTSCVIDSPIAGTLRFPSDSDSSSSGPAASEVKPGVPVALVELDKETVQVPADCYGTITDIPVSHGKRVAAGQPLLHIRKEALGLGDVKLLAVIGAFLGWKLALLTLLLSSVVGLLGHVLTVVIGRGKWHAEIPFGVYIVPASLISYFWGHAILRWYVDTFIL